MLEKNFKSVRLSILAIIVDCLRRVVVGNNLESNLYELKILHVDLNIKALKKLYNIPV